MILSAMVAFFVVMFILAAAINVVNYSVVTSRADQTLSDILAFEESQEVFFYEGTAPNPVFPRAEDQEFSYMTRFFTVRYDEDGMIDSILMDYIASVDETTAQEYADTVLKKGKVSGYLNNYRYAVKQYDSNTVVAFLNISREQEFTLTLLKLSVLAAVLSLILVFLLVFLFSNRAIRPFARNIEQQKRFITDAGHELKTPLTSVSASLDVLDMEYGENEWLSNIRLQIDRMSKMVGDLVTLSKLDEKDPIPGNENYSLSETAWEIAEAFQVQAKAQNKSFTADITDNITMTGDRGVIQKMLSALLDNAVRYSGEDGRINFTVTEKSGRIQIISSNTCHFDTPPDTKRLFDRFYRPDESRTSETGGTGIGLAIVKSAAEAHGGTVSASCPDGNEMTIKIIL